MLYPTPSSQYPGTNVVGVCDTDGRCYRSGLSYERVVEDVQQIHDAFFLSDGNAQYF